jgi:hypothetical protein
MRDADARFIVLCKLKEQPPRSVLREGDLRFFGILPTGSPLQRRAAFLQMRGIRANGEHQATTFAALIPSCVINVQRTIDVRDCRILTPVGIILTRAGCNRR